MVDVALTASAKSLFTLLNPARFAASSCCNVVYHHSLALISPRDLSTLSQSYPTVGLRSKVSERYKDTRWKDQGSCVKDAVGISLHWSRPLENIEQSPILLIELQ